MHKVWKPEKGSITIDGKNLEELRHKDFAQKITVAHQNHHRSDLTVEETLEMGRYSYKVFLKVLTKGSKVLSKRPWMYWILGRSATEL
jgi:ABC-type cobalamin/Fe3+-siderophores transport system ATPase subunit